MSKRKYEYKSPTTNGFTQFKVSRKAHNLILPKRKITIFQTFKYYYNEHGIKTEMFTNWFGILLCVLMFPYYLLVHGLGELTELLDEYKDLFNQKKCGSFSSKHIPKGSKQYEQLSKYFN